MKPTACLTNIARGGIVDDAALRRHWPPADRRGRLVSSKEPALNPALLAVPNVVLTPNMPVPCGDPAAMANLAADNLIADWIRTHPGRPPSPIIEVRQAD